jgi:hypothetical protein
LRARSGRRWTRSANIDHVAVGPGGVFVIDSKNWSGEIRVVDGTLWQEGRRRERETAAAADAARAVTELLEGLAATPVLCFVRDEPVEGWAGDVMVCSTRNLAARLGAIPSMLGPVAMAGASTVLQAQLAPASLVTTRREPGARTEIARRPAGRRTRRGRASSRGSLRRTERITLAKGLVIAIAVAVGAVVGLPKLAAHTPELLGLKPIHAELGQTVELHGSSTRPTMDLTAGTPVVLPRKLVKMTLGSRQRLVAVRVRVSNASVMTWTSPRVVVAARDSAGAVLNRVGLRRSKARPPLPAVIRLRPGSVVDGYVAFAVPRAARLTGFALTLGHSSYEVVRWSEHSK